MASLVEDGVEGAQDETGKHEHDETGDRPLQALYASGLSGAAGGHHDLDAADHRLEHGHAGGGADHPRPGAVKVRKEDLDARLGIELVVVVERLQKVERALVAELQTTLVVALGQRRGSGEDQREEREQAQEAEGEGFTHIKTV